MAIRILGFISQRPVPTKWRTDLWAFASTVFTKPADRQPGEPEQEVDPFTRVLRDARSVDLEDLRNTGREVRGIARQLDPERTTVLVDQPNMKARILGASRSGTLRGVRYFHFATHASHDPNRPNHSGLYLCPPYPGPGIPAGPRGDSEPAAASTRRGVGDLRPPALLGRSGSAHRAELLTMSDIAGLDLDSELVFLSACRTIGERRLEGDWLSGIARSFLVAGCSGVICTAWKIDDSRASVVVPQIYAKILDHRTTAAGAADVPRALQRFKTSLLRSPAYGHPSLWAPWMYHGRLHRPGS